MSISKILVTGAGGFIGNRVTHRIALGENAAVKAMVHSLSGPGTMRLSRLPIEIESGSVLDEERLETLLSDCDAVINCAHGTRETVVDGTRTLLSVAENQDISTYIHLSSAVVHGHDRRGVITESTSFEPDTQYARVKAEAEGVISDWTGDVQPTIFRPCIVYGPHSPWVENPIREIRQGAVLAENGVGEVNQMYIDNLVDALLCAVYEPDAAGEVFLAADDEPLSWRQYYLRLGNVLGDHPPVQSMTTSEIRRAKAVRTLTDSVVPPVRLCKEVFSAPETVQRAAAELQQTPWASKLYRGLPEGLRESIDVRLDDESETFEVTADAAVERPVLPDENLQKMQSTRTIVSNKKLKTQLGWEQQVPFEEAIELIAAWARYEELTTHDGHPSSVTGTHQRTTTFESDSETVQPQQKDSIIQG